MFNYDYNLYKANLDVQSLFTNFPLEETVKNCNKDLFSNTFVEVNQVEKTYMICSN